MKKILAVLVTVMFAVGFTAIDAEAKGSSGGGGRSGGSSSGGRSSSAPKSGSSSKSGGSSSGRKTTPPKSSSSNKSGSSGRATKAPTKTGTKISPSTVKNTVQPNKGKINISKNTVAGGKSYKVPGTNKTYTYNRTTYDSYYTTYRGGYLGYYPPLGTPTYWLLWNDPFFYPNYITVGSPWYGHPTPVGYSVEDGKLIAKEKGNSFPWGTVFLVILVLALVAVAAYFLVQARRKAAADRPYGDL